MKSYNPKVGISKNRPVIEQIESLHPFKMINYLGISITCILYATISIMFIKHLVYDLNGIYTFHLPDFFAVSLIIIICSAYFTSRILGAYKNDNIPLVRKLLGLAIVSGLLFFFSQFVAWMEILKTDEITNSSISTYLFIISSVHLAYVFVGIVMSTILYFKYLLIENDPVKTLIAITNPIEKVKLEIYGVLWHFIVISWVLIFLMLLFTL